MSNKWNSHSAEFKAEVALAALRNDETMADLGIQFDFHPTVIKDCKLSLVESCKDF
jgi:transposase